MDFKNIRNILVFISMVVFLQACGTSKTVVLDPLMISETQKIRSISLKPVAHTVQVDQHSADLFEQVIKAELYKKLKYAQGNDTVITYKFIQYDRGSRFMRYLLGGIGNTGEGSMTVEFRFLNKEGAEIGKIQTEGKIGSGIFGGSMDNAVASSAEALVTYIKKSRCV